MSGVDVPDRVGGARTIRRGFLLLLALVSTVVAAVLLVATPQTRPFTKLSIAGAGMVVVVVWRVARTTLTLAFAPGRFAAVGEHQVVPAPDQGRGDEGDLVHHWMELLDLDDARPSAWVQVEARHVRVLEASDVVAVWGEGSWWARVVLNGPDFTIVPEEVGSSPP